MFTEKWVFIKGFIDYEISSYGRVYSCKREIILTPYLNGWGYETVDLLRNGERYRRRVHRLVAEAFVENIFNKPEVNHIDGNKTNNRADNLEWVTNQENVRHAFDTGLNVRSSYDAGKPKRKVLVVETGQIYESINECARQLKCNHSTVIACLKGKQTTCKGYHLNYFK